MKCKNCQQSMPAKAKYCPECGHQISKSNSQQSAIASSNKLEKPAQAYILVIAAVAVAILIVILILDSNQKSIEQNAVTSTNAQDFSNEIKVQLEKIKQDPNSIPLNIEMGNLLFDSGRFDEAIPFYQKVLSMDLKNIAVQIDLAVCFFNLRKIDQALLEMDKALKIDPNHPKGLFNMGIIYYNIGDFDKVREYWNRLISIHPELMESKRAMELLQNIED